jgi:hypothetical protein
VSRGPGRVEQRIADLFAETQDHALSVEDICDRVFELKGQLASRAQRLSATRAAHRLLRRVRETAQQSAELFTIARQDTDLALGREEWSSDDKGREEWRTLFEGHPLYGRASLLWEWTRPFRYMRGIERIEDRPGSWQRGIFEYWQATATGRKRLFFHPPDVPVRVWAVSIQAAGVIWAEAEVLKITERNVMVRYAGERARLDRLKLWRWWAWWRGVMFVSSRTGRIAVRLDEIWQEWYGYTAGSSTPPVMQMPLADAIALLGVPLDYTYDDVIAAFRREAKKVHPDVGGTAEQFRALVEARDRLLAALGTSAPAPKMPAYAPKGVQLVYRVGRSTRLLGSTRHLSRSTRLLTY